MNANMSRDVQYAPAAAFTGQRNFFGFRFGSAPSHDEFPHGGCRIAGVLPGGADTASMIGNVSAPSLFGAIFGVAVSPTAIGTSATMPLGRLWSSTGPIASFAQYFRRFRFRKLFFEYAANSPTSSADNRVIEVAYESDASAADNTTYTASTGVTEQVDRFSAWTPNRMIPLIRESKTSRADELFYTTVAGDTLQPTSSNSAQLRQCSQGAIIAVSNAATSGSITFGTNLIHFVLDLYGFTNDTQNLLPQDGEPRVRGRVTTDQPTVPRVRRVEPRVETDYVSLTPRSDRGDFKQLPKSSSRK